MRRQYLFIVGALLLGVYGQTLAGAFEDATAAYKRGDYAKAVELIRPLAERGDVRAQFNLATLYYNGQGGREDLPEAAKWFRMAAECRALAHDVCNEGSREELLALADVWMTLADAGRVHTLEDSRLLYRRSRSIST